MSTNVSREDEAPKESSNRFSIPSEYRQRVEQLRLDAAERRQSEIAEQRSVFKTPSERIRTWERLHQLTLPSRFGHPLTTTIATDTGLSLHQVQAEQRSRLAAPSSD